MIQLYFLSIVCNGLSGYSLFAGSENEAVEKPRFFNPTTYLVLGILSAVVGFLKILSPSADNLLILGDLLPAAGGITAGFLLVFGIYRQGSFSASQTQGTLSGLGVGLLQYRKSIGLGLMVIALLHFLFHDVNIL
jgi:hypothetical protein